MAEISALKDWVAQQLSCTSQQLNWQPLSGDASFRRYVRCKLNDQSYIAALAPPATEKNDTFVQVSGLLNQAGVPAPKVLAVDYGHGYLLQSDLGDTALQAVLSENTVQHWYPLAMRQIARMQSIQDTGLPLYDRAALQLELSYFRTWFLEAMLNYQCSANETAMLEKFFTALLDSAEQQPQAFVHRDYHCRNIMCLSDGSLACIDFQDAVIGPVTYDAVSLLRDCYVVWPQEQVQNWVEDYRQQYWPMIDSQQFQQWFDLMSLQRHIKVLGIFARLSIRDGKHNYLNDLPTVIRYVLNVARQQAAANEFAVWFEQRILPLVRQQHWGCHL